MAESRRGSDRRERGNPPRTPPEWILSRSRRWSIIWMSSRSSMVTRRRSSAARAYAAGFRAVRSLADGKSGLVWRRRLSSGDSVDRGPQPGAPPRPEDGWRRTSAVLLVVVAGLVPPGKQPCADVPGLCFPAPAGRQADGLAAACDCGGDPGASGDRAGRSPARPRVSAGPRSFSHQRLRPHSGARPLRLSRLRAAARGGPTLLPRSGLTGLRSPASG